MVRRASIGLLAAVLVAPLSPLGDPPASAAPPAPPPSVGFAWGSGFPDSPAHDFPEGAHWSYSPVEVLDARTDLASVAAGSTHFLALTESGAVLAWGWNDNGQLGVKAPEHAAEAILVDVPPATSLDASPHGGGALAATGELWLWGYAPGREGPERAPFVVDGLPVVSAFDVGGGHALAVDQGGSVWAWGANWNGQLGNGTTESSLEPAVVPGVEATAVSAGDSHSLALAPDGTVWAWGYGLEGQLGNGAAQNSDVPVKVSGLTDVVAISAGSLHNLALRADGTVWAWGVNGGGALGDGGPDEYQSDVDSSVPIQVAAVTGAVAISAGSNFSLAVSSDGTAWAWGDNWGGRLGIGEKSQVVRTPRPIEGLTGTAAVSAGGSVAMARARQPEVRINAPRGHHVASSGAVTLAGTGPANRTVWASANGHTVGQARVAGDGTWSLPVELSEGFHRLTVSLSGPSGTPVAVSTAEVDSTPPDIVVSHWPEAPAVATWYREPVWVTFECFDEGSGIGSCGPSRRLDEEGPGQVVTGVAVDRAGNETTASAGPFDLDLHGPQVEVTEERSADATGGWHREPVTVTFECTDTASGVASCPEPVVADTEGAVEISAAAEDVVGHVTEVTHEVRLDMTAPTISASVIPDPGGQWSARSLVVHFECDDALSGVAECPDDVVVEEGADQTVTGSATDVAGNVASVTIEDLDVDLTAPTIQGTASPSPNSEGWNKTPVSVRFACADVLSGVATCTPQQQVGEGEGQSVPGTATDHAGNTASTVVTGLNVDVTPPVIHGEATPAPNEHGWNATAVRVRFQCSDALSGVASCPSDRWVTSGKAVSVSGTASDRAGNSASATVSGINVDQTPPTITATLDPPRPASGWWSSPVTVSFDCADSLSGVAECPEDIVVAGSGADQVVEGTVVDRAGNTRRITVGDIDVDLSVPTITAAVSPDANDRGWRTTPVTVSFTCSDAHSGVASCPAPVTLWNGENQSVTRSVSDRAGHTASVTVDDIDVDHTAPQILPWSVSPRPNEDGWSRAPVVARFLCFDATSGVLSCTDEVEVQGEGRDLSVTGTAVDRAGNEASLTRTGFNIDRTPPATTMTAPDPPAVVGLLDPIGDVRGTASDALSGIKQVEVSFRPVGPLTSSGPSGGFATVECDEPVGTCQWSYRPSQGQRGTYDVVARSQDRGGNWGPWTEPVEMIVVSDTDLGLPPGGL